MNLWDEVTAEDFKDDTTSLLVDEFGLKIAKRMVEILGGDSPYIPKAESIIRMVRDRRIYKQFQDGKEYRELAIKYNLTPRHIREIIKEQKKYNRQINESQLDLF